MSDALTVALQAIRTRLKKATPGPWHVHGRIFQIYSGTRIPGKNYPELNYMDVPSIRPKEDADFIAHAPTDIAHLLALVEAGEEMAQFLQDIQVQLDDEWYEGAPVDGPADEWRRRAGEAKEVGKKILTHYIAVCQAVVKDTPCP